MRRYIIQHVTDNSMECIGSLCAVVLYYTHEWFRNSCCAAATDASNGWTAQSEILQCRSLRIMGIESCCCCYWGIVCQTDARNSGFPESRRVNGELFCAAAYYAWTILIAKGLLCIIIHIAESIYIYIYVIMRLQTFTLRLWK